MTASMLKHLLLLIGGGSGFGAAIARRFGEEGAKVIVADINAEGGEKVAAQNPANLVFLRVDVTQAEEWRQVTDLAFSKFGKLDILVNNAGTTYRNKVGSPHSINSERIGDVES
jgi:NAD(P)-dependent dehydrogenase (short-subunit alcohol dehydrogenase family)